MVYTNYNLLLNSSPDFPRPKLLQFLTFDRICFLSLCHPSISPLSTRLLGVHDRCPHAFFSNIRQKDYWDIDGSLGTLTIYIVAECRHIFISVIGLSDLKCASRDKRIAVVKQRVLETSIRLQSAVLHKEGSIHDHRRKQLRDASAVGVFSQRRQRKNSKGSQYHLRIQTECVERFRRIKSRSLSLTNMSRPAPFKSDGPMMEIKMWRPWRQCISPKYPISHRYPNGPSTECSRRRGAWQRSHTPTT